MNKIKNEIMLINEMTKLIHNNYVISTKAFNNTESIDAVYDDGIEHEKISLKINGENKTLTIIYYKIFQHDIPSALTMFHHNILTETENEKWLKQQQQKGKFIIHDWLKIGEQTLEKNLKFTPIIENRKCEENGTHNHQYKALKIEIDNTDATPLLVALDGRDQLIELWYACLSKN